MSFKFILQCLFTSHSIDLANPLEQLVERQGINLVNKLKDTILGEVVEQL